jgi:hypothetical protein
MKKTLKKILCSIFAVGIVAASSLALINRENNVIISSADTTQQELLTTATSEKTNQKSLSASTKPFIPQDLVDRLNGDSNASSSESSSSGGFLNLSGSSSEILDLTNLQVLAKLNEKTESGYSIVETQLMNMRQEYVDMLEYTTDPEKIEQINVAIKDIDNIAKIDVSPLLNKKAQSTMAMSSLEQKIIDEGMVLAAITLFSELKYKLSAELLVHALSSAQLNTPTIHSYNPVYAGIVYSSPTLYEIANGSTKTGTAEFINTGTRNQKDLYFSIHGFSFTKDSETSKKFVLMDKYNFDPVETEGENAELNKILNMFNGAQNRDVIREYHIRLEIDTEQYVYIEKLGTTGLKTKIKITNYGKTTRDVIYNTKLANEDDVRNWQGLTDIAYTSLAPNASFTTIIEPNGNADSFAICLTEGNKRYITMADTSSPFNIECLTQTTKTNDDNIELIGKTTDSGWLVKFKNNSGITNTVTYNSTLCNEDDAKYWKNLNNTVSFNLADKQSKIIKIKSNYYANSIAAKITNKKEITTYYINNMNTNGYMNIGKSSEAIYYHLNISIVGKSSNKWQIRIFNTFYEDVMITYNTKMCHEGDAREWKNLTNCASLIITKNSYKIVTIQENWFASFITVSYVYNGKRIITYANELNTNKTLNMLTNIINA